MTSFSQVSYKRMGSVDRAPTLSSSSYNKVVTSRYAGSVYAGAGGYGTKISTGSGFAGGFGLGSSLSSSNLNSSFQISTNSDLLLTGNEKATMQNLNDRLATYLDKVRSLEKANTHLEIQIKEWYSNNSISPDKEYNHYYRIIEELKAKILNSSLENARTLLQIDNAKLAAEDFRLKLESELAFRVSVEKDIIGLRKVIDELSLTKADIELQIEALHEELIYLKKNHEDEISVLRKQVGGRVSVEVDAAPSVDLAKVLAEMRIQCEAVIEKNRQEAKERFETLIQQISVEITTSETKLHKYTTTIKEVQRNVQVLEIELQSELSKKNGLSVTLENINEQYASHLANMQATISSLEAQLLQIRSDMGRQSQEYELLLNIKVRLEIEIATYRRLLEGEEEKWELAIEEERLREQNRSRKIKTIVEEMVDGKIVSSEVREVEEQLPSTLVQDK